MGHRARQYLIAVAALAAAILVRWVLDPVIGDSLPLVTLFGAVAGAAWLGGYRPALLVVILGYLACAYLFIPPRGAIDLTTYETVVGLIAYLLTCSLIIGIGEGMRRYAVREYIGCANIRTVWQCGTARHDPATGDSGAVMTRSCTRWITLTADDLSTLEDRSDILAGAGARRLPGRLVHRCGGLGGSAADSKCLPRWGSLVPKLSGTCRR